MPTGAPVTTKSIVPVKLEPRTTSIVIVIGGSPGLSAATDGAKKSAKSSGATSGSASDPASLPPRSLKFVKREHATTSVDDSAKAKRISSQYTAVDESKGSNMDCE